MGVTAALAEFAVRLNVDDVPERALAEARRAFVDLIGTALAGSVEPSSGIVAVTVRAEAAAGSAALIGHGLRVSPTFAALANGTSAHALDFDDIGLDVGHPSAAVVPAALAVAEETGASGQELLMALVVGYEVASRVGRAAGTVSEGPYRRGFHGTSVFGVFGSAAAAARLLNLSADQTVHALGIAASEAGGVRTNFGTMTKPLHAGETNRAGVLAALLASRGFTASSDGIAGKYGWNDAFAAGDSDLVKLTQGLGESFAIEEGVDVKRYPCCGANHAALNGFRRVLTEQALDLDEIATVEVEQSAYSVNEILIYPWPASGLEGKFSLAYNMAAALADGTVTIDSFTDERVAELEPYRERVRIIPTDEDRKEVVVRVETTGGEAFELTQPSGMPVQPGGRRFPLSDAELYAKFQENAGRAKSPAEVAALLRSLDTLADAKSLTPLTDLLL